MTNDFTGYVSGEPHISVVIGVYNMEMYIGATLRSVLAQTFTDFEIIIVDDGSLDRTVEEITGIHDPRIRLIRLSHQGSANARNHAISLARGKLIAFLDGDDLWEPGKLAVHVETFRQHSDIDLTFDLVRHIDEKGNDLGYRMDSPTLRPTFENVLIHNMIACGSVTVARREAVAKTGGFSPELPAFIDTDLWLRLLLLRSDNTICIPRALTAYRRHDKQITGKWKRMERAWPILLGRLQKLVPERVGKVKPFAYAVYYRGLAALAHEQNDRLSSWGFLMKAVAFNPRYTMSYVDFWRLLATMSIRLVLPARLHRALRKTASRLQVTIAT